MMPSRLRYGRVVRLRRAFEDVLDECNLQVEEFGVQRHHPAY